MTPEEYVHMEIRVAIGFKAVSATDILTRLGETAKTESGSSKGYGWLKRHLTKMLKDDLIEQVKVDGHIKYKVVL